MKNYIKRLLMFSAAVILLQVMLLGVAAQESDTTEQTAAAKTEKQNNAATATVPSKNALEKRVGLEVSLHLLIVSNNAQQEKLPVLLDGVAKQIRSTLNISSVNLATTLLHRVETLGGLQVKGIGTASLASPTSNPQTLPTFYDYSISQISLGDETDAQDKIRLNRFSFAMRFPIYLSPRAESVQQVNYESIAIHTSATLKENEPTIIGTTNLGRPDETLVVVITVKRVGSR